MDLGLTSTWVEEGQPPDDKGVVDSFGCELRGQNLLDPFWSPASLLVRSVQGVSK